MQRRKFVLGLGSLAAGGATVFGTSAISSFNGDRKATASFTGDNNAYLTFRKGDMHGALVSQTAPKLVLNIDRLNRDGVSTFDQVFKIINTNPGEAVDVKILSNKPRLGFYFGEGPTSTTPSTPKDSDRKQINPGASRQVGVIVNAEGKNSGTIGGDDAFTVDAADGSN